MLFLYNVQIKSNLYFIVDVDKKTKMKLARRNVIENSKYIENIEAFGGELKGKGFSIRMFNGNRVYVYKIIRHNERSVYCIIDKDGNTINNLSGEELISIVNKNGAVNANIDNKGRITVSPKSYVEIIVNEKEINYDREEYYKLYRRYQNIGLSSDATVTARYDNTVKPVFGKYYPTSRDMESKHYSFVKAHKNMAIILKKSYIIGYTSLYEEYTVNKRSIKCSKLIGVLVYYENRYGQFKVIIDKEDKKILHMLKKVEMKGIGINTLMDILSTEEYDGNTLDSINTVNEKIRGLNIKEIECIKSLLDAGQTVKLTLKNGIYMCDDMLLYIRNDIKINCGFIGINL